MRRNVQVAEQNKKNRKNRGRTRTKRKENHYESIKVPAKMKKENTYESIKLPQVPKKADRRPTQLPAFWAATLRLATWFLHIFVFSIE